jgi:hypothetical protein
MAMGSNLEQLLQQLRVTGRKLTEESPVRFLRPFQRQLDGVQHILREPHIKFLCFFMSSFIGDVFYNLAGDVPPDEDIYQARSEVLTRMGKALIALAENIESEAYDKCYDCYVDLVNFYISKIEKLNQRID